MWPFSKKSARRQEIRRSRTERRRGWWYQRLPMRYGVWPVSVSIATAVFAALIINAGGPTLNVREGQNLRRALTARIEIKVENEQQTRDMRNRARDSSPDYYRLDTSLIDDIRGRLTNVLTWARTHLDDAEQLREIAAANDVVLDDDGLAEMQRLAALEDSSDFQKFVDSAVLKLRVKPLVDPLERRANRRSSTKAVLLDAGSARNVSDSQLLFTKPVEPVNAMIAEVAASFPEPLRASMAASIAALLRISDAGPGGAAAFRPLYRFDAAQTLDVAEKAADDVETQYIVYARGDVLADAGPVSLEELTLLREEHEQHSAHVAAAGRTQLRIGTVARSALVFLVVFGVIAYMSRYQRAVFTNNLRRTVASVALLAVFAGARLLYSSADVTPYAAVGFHAFAAAMLGIVYAHGAVFAICAGLGILITFAVQQTAAFFLVLMAVSGVFVFGLREVRNRGKIVGVGLIAAAVALVGSVAVGIIQEQDLRFALRQGLWAASTTLLAAFIIEGILPGIERVFTLSTGMTLLEWCDASKPLMRLLAENAAGTFNHSQMVGTLAEAASEAIGANGLLARTGAYYHDIGKTNKPEYFVENQTAGINRHERLSPAMSHLIIVGHVKDGIEMAKEYGLPASLRPFIAQHHGTTLVEYFYHAATKQRSEDQPEISETAFRYPGPKPQSRETAIVMLCDGVEGAVRAMPEPTPNRIETVVSQIIRKRLMDDQLDECDLTFRELAAIEKSLVKSLCSIYHARITYPEKAEDKRPTETKAS